jgi:hypothetical protein
MVTGTNGMELSWLTSNLTKKKVYFVIPAGANGSTSSPQNGEPKMTALLSFRPKQSPSTARQAHGRQSSGQIEGDIQS